MDDSGCLTFIIVIIVIFVLVWLAGITINLLGITFPAWGAGLASAVVGYGVSRLKLTSNLKSPSKISDLIEFDFDGLKLKGKIKHIAVNNYTKNFKIAPIVLCIFVTVITYVVVISETNKLGNLEEWKHGFAVIATFLVPIGLAIIMWKKIDFATLAKDKIKQAVNKVNKSFQSSERLRDIIRKNAILARKLGIEFPQNNIAKIQNFVDSNGSIIITDPSSLDSVIKTEIESVENDKSNLHEAKKLLDRVMQLHNEVSQTIFSTGSPSMVNAIDIIHEEIHQAKEVCLPKREWSTFEEVITMNSEDLKKLEKQAKNLTTNEKPKFESDDPYKVLGVTSEMKYNEIKRIFRELCKIYHPDKGKVQDASKFKEIKKAYDKIKNHR